MVEIGVYGTRKDLLRSDSSCARVGKPGGLKFE